MADTLTDLYQAHCEDSLADNDERWDTVQRLLLRISRRVVGRTRAGSWHGGLYGAQAEHITDNVYTGLLTKFLERRFQVRGANIEPLLAAAAKNQCIDALRRSRSPIAHGLEDPFEGHEQADVTQDPVHANSVADLFDRIRLFLPAFRFHEYPHVREVLLGVFLSLNRYPGAHFLDSVGVPQQVRRSVYTAAVFDINSAIMSVMSDEHQAA
jgi:DNA-directed RNA polymerase specialized sigma24 family protein